MRFQDFTIDFKISRKISRFQDFTKDFKISRKISRFQERFHSKCTRFQRVADPSDPTTVTLAAHARRGLIMVPSCAVRELYRLKKKKKKKMEKS